jgi:hypothetical protein
VWHIGIYPLNIVEYLEVADFSFVVLQEFFELCLVVHMKNFHHNTLWALLVGEEDVPVEGLH